MPKKFNDRIELRIDSELKKKLDIYAGQNEKSQAEVIRDALSQYLQLEPFKDILWKSLENKSFCVSFQRFLKSAPPKVNSFFEEYWGREEERIIKETPGNVLWSLELAISTKRGIKAFKKKSKS